MIDPLYITAGAAALGSFTVFASASALISVRKALRETRNALITANQASEITLKNYTRLILEMGKERRHQERVEELLRANNEYLERARVAERTGRSLGDTVLAQEAAIDYLANALDIQPNDFADAPDEIKATVGAVLIRTGYWNRASDVAQAA